MIQIAINSTICDTSSATKVTLNWDSSSLHAIEKQRSGLSVAFELPSTPLNDRTLLYPADIHAAEIFNNRYNRAQIFADAELLFEGVAYLRQTTHRDGLYTYTIEVVGGAADWAKEAFTKRFNKTPIDFSTRHTTSAAIESWYNDSPVKFFPVQHDSYSPPALSVGSTPVEKFLSSDDYYPFFSVATALKSIFTQAGFTVESRFLDSAFFRSLFVSGRYSSVDTAAMSRNSGFFAQRRHTTSTKSDAWGRIYANPFSTSSSVGNIVDSASGSDTDDEGRVLTENFNSNNSLKIDSNGELVYAPPSRVMAGFEFHIKYRTKYRIKSHDELSGINSFCLGEGAERIIYKISNPNIDRTDSLQSGFQYRIIVFDQQPSTTYALRLTLSNGNTVTPVELTSRSKLFVMPTLSAPYIRADLYAKSSASASYVKSELPFAVYSGYIEEEGYADIEVTHRTPLEEVSPTSPRYFRNIYFSGEHSGWDFTLKCGTSLRPVFGSSVGYGSKVTFAEVAQHDFSQGEFIESIAHLFNLRLFTDSLHRRVYIEPHDTFYCDSAPFDWTEYICLDQPVKMWDAARDVSAQRTLCYKEDDGAVRRQNALLGNELGAWTAYNESFAAKMRYERIESPLFSPSVSSTEYLQNAPSALIPQVGDRDRNDEQQNGNFSPRIVLFAGMHPLPKGERWSYPLFKAEYPLVAFSFEGDTHAEAFTLSFADSPTATGLHHYYDSEYAPQQERQMVQLSLRIAPHLYSTLFAVDSTSTPTIRSAYRLVIGGSSSLYHIHSIDSYDPEQGVALITFTRLLKD